MKIRLSDLEDALMFASAGMGMDASAYVDRETGEIYYAGELVDADELPEDLEVSDRYLKIPDKRELDLGQSLVFDFVADHAAEEHDRVRDIFRRRGAYGRFKDFLDDKGLLDTWYRYEEDKTRDALREWCSDEGLNLVE